MFCIKKERRKFEGKLKPMAKKPFQHDLGIHVLWALIFERDYLYLACM